MISPHCLIPSTWVSQRTGVRILLGQTTRNKQFISCWKCVYKHASNSTVIFSNESEERQWVHSSGFLAEAVIQALENFAPPRSRSELWIRNVVDTLVTNKRSKNEEIHNVIVNIFQEIKLTMEPLTK